MTKVTTNLDLQADPALRLRVANAGTAVFNMILNSIADQRGVHLETAIASAGYLAGTAMLKGCGIAGLSTCTPGSTVLVDQVNEVGPEVMEYMMNELAARPGMANGVPEDHQPLRSYLDLVGSLWPKFEQIAQQFEIPAGVAAFAGAGAAARMIVAGEQQLSPAIGKLIAVEAMVKASKTAPPV